MKTEVKARWRFEPLELRPVLKLARVICSECGKDVITSETPPPEYCPRCKAKMVIPEADFEEYLDSFGEYKIIADLTRQKYEEEGMVEHEEVQIIEG